ncbi:MAG: FtsX-like permease family protein [Candidatus Omnitrophica bacterium]|nr:FtsX-like permease family protein [Candidatus Omnitrophota bacterium]
MNVLRFIFKEILHRKINFTLSLIAITLAVAFSVSFFTMGTASKRETIRLMRDMGYNLRIISNKTDMNFFYSNGYSDQTLPEEHVQKFAAQKGLLYAHLLGTLQRSIDWRGRRALLTGIAPEISPVGKEKPPMIYTIKPGAVYIGYELAKGLSVQKGDQVEILGGSFHVENVLREAGSEDDVRILAALQDVQNLLNEKGRINEIQALNCFCVVEGRDPLDMLREQLAVTLPDTHVIQKRAIAEARTRQRELMDNYFALILPFLLVVCAVWVGALAFLNARDRRQEIGVLRALGYDSKKIALLFIGKAVMIGAVGAVLGFIMGTAFALAYGADIFKVTFQKIEPIYSLLVIALIAAPVFTAVSSFIPAMIAVTQDPAECLREE